MTDAVCLHAASEADADILYASGFFAPDPFVWFRKGWRSYVLVPTLEVGRAKREARAHHVIDTVAARKRLERRTGEEADSHEEVIASILKDKGVSSLRVPQRFPLFTAEVLRRAGIRVRTQRDPFFPDRVVKRDDEIARIREAQAANERALEAGLDVLRKARARRGLLSLGGERVTAELLKRVIAESALRDGCVAQHTIVAVGDQSVDCHETGSGPIPVNTPVVIDIFPRHRSGYWADMTRTVVRGKASAEIREIYDVVAEGQRHAFDRIRGGCAGRPIHRGIQELFDGAGWKTESRNGRAQGFIHGTGHGVGLDIHEPPWLGARDDTLPAGSVVTVEPGLYYEGIGGVRLEDMVLVTESGCENLTGAPKQLEL